MEQYAKLPTAQELRVFPAEPLCRSDAITGTDHLQIEEVGRLKRARCVPSKFGVQHFGSGPSWLGE